MNDKKASFDTVFRDSYRDVVRAISPIVGSVTDGESVAQEAFLKAYVRWRRIGQYDQPGAWVRRVAIRDAVRFAERHRRRPAPDIPRSTDVEHTVITHLHLVRLLGRLSPKQRACVVLHHLADAPVAEVADTLGCTEATVRVHLHRARVALAAALDADREETRDAC